MRAEIVMACRKELPRNLRLTVQNIKATMSQDDGMEVVLDGPHDGIDYRLKEMNTIQPFDHPRGPGQCRNYSITESAADIVIIVDAHMSFPVGWIDAICAHLAKHPKDVTCCHMIGVDHNWRPVDDGGIYDGCHLEQRLPHPSEKNWWINSVWNKFALPHGVVGSIMGACYGITRQWYETIGNPLAILEAWGGDEEILSAASWLMGGRCYLLPPICKHIWAAPRLRPPEIEYTERYEMWGNHYAMLEALPVGDPEREIMRKHMDKSNNRIEKVAERVAVRADAINHLRETLAGAPRTWEDLKTMGVIQPVGAKEFKIAVKKPRRGKKQI